MIGTTGVATRVLRIVGEEMRSWPKDRGVRAQALNAAVELLDRPRATWPAPTSPWETIVTNLAVAMLRVEGGLAVPRARARSLVAVVLDGEPPPSRWRA